MSNPTKNFIAIAVLGLAAFMLGAFVGQSSKAEAQQRSDAISVIQLAYTEPHLPPEQEAGIVFELCWATYGGE